MSSELKKPKITVALGVYNAEKFIQQRLENLLSQTFQDFEILISDDSTDRTVDICKEFAAKDNRIRYIHHDKKMGWEWTWKFLIENATGKYFLITGVDDKLSLDFLEKNSKFLDSNADYVISTGKPEFFGPGSKMFDFTLDDNFSTRMYKKFRRKFRKPLVIISKEGTFEQKAGFCLRNDAYGHTIGVCRTEQVKKSSKAYDKPFFVCDWAYSLDCLRDGKIHLFDQVMQWTYVGGFTSKGIINQWKVQKTRFNEYFLPYSTFTYWCIKNIGWKFFLKNFDCFIWLNFRGIIAILIDIKRKTF